MIVWVIRKVKFYLRGMPHFDLITDHRTLMGVFSKLLAQLDNRHLARIREKVMDFNFNIVWRPGKENVIMDALSRASTGGASHRDKPIPVFACILALQALIGVLTECTCKCTSYRAIKEAITGKAESHHHAEGPPCLAPPQRVSCCKIMHLYVSIT